MSQHIPPQGFYRLHPEKFKSILPEWDSFLYGSGTNKGNLWYRKHQGHNGWCPYSCMPSKKRLNEDYIFLGPEKPDFLPPITQKHI